MVTKKISRRVKPPLPPDAQLLEDVGKLIIFIKNTRPGDGSDLDRRYSIAVTKSEDLYAHVYTYILAHLVLDQ